ncbi:hypothetical protein [Thermofilum pendens]|uniref:Uncharacterized protein n=1 Tax=Thermofilum pendens (strain DSM 2475 / Hrk 5) TaxID=368408 RepID=A1RZR7_THEPD|nr:hypothetical protein [Thermofilum pendens]ABL78697.1 hypothetical protein Tpen_1299 [Thermofilum pendens Hrk 5]
MASIAVRVRLRVARGGVAVETPALANTGYEAETPQLLVPVRLAQELGLWPPGPGVEETEYETAGGPLRVWVAPRACRVSVLAPGASSPEVEADIVVSPLACEVLMSDKLIGELGVAIEDAGRGLWRFRWEPKEALRRSEPPRYWK